MRLLAHASGALMLALTLLVSPLSAKAQTVGQAGPGGASYYLSTTQNPVGQTVTAPNVLLTAFSMRLSNAYGPVVTATPQVSEWSGGVRGAVIWTGTPITVSDPAPTTVTIQTGSLPVVAGQQYLIELTSPSVDSIIMDYATPGGYGAGSVVVMGVEAPTSDLIFTANFAAPVPTVSEWTMILLGLTLAAGAILIVQRRTAAL